MDHRADRHGGVGVEPEKKVTVSERDLPLDRHPPTDSRCVVAGRRKMVLYHFLCRKLLMGNRLILTPGVFRLEKYHSGGCRESRVESREPRDQ